MDFTSFPSTRYQGSKRKLLPWIYDNVKDIKFNTVLDAFGGTASVSYLFKKMNKEVTYNDNLSFNYHTGRALIENKKVKLQANDLEFLIGHNLGIDYDYFISNNFDKIYYLKDENSWLDTFVTNILNMNHYSHQTLKYKISLAYNILAQACLVKRPFNLFHRKNLKLRTRRNVVRNFSNKLSWDKSFEKHVLKFTKEINSAVFDNGRNCRAINKSVFDIKNVDYDLVYLDPPYLSKNNNNETANYLRYYHFLEGLVNYADWDDLIDYNSINLRFRACNIQSNFNSNDIYYSFERMIDIFRGSKLIISYKKGGVPSIEFIVRLLKRFNKKVYTRSKHYSYALNHQNGNSKLNREVLIIAL